MMRAEHFNDYVEIDVMENDLLMRGLAAWEDLVSQCGRIDFQDDKWQAFEHGGNGIAQGDTLSQLLCNMAVLWETSGE